MSKGWRLEDCSSLARLSGEVPAHISGRLAVLDAELGQHGRDVVIDRLGRDKQRAGDPGVGLPFADQREHLAFARGEPEWMRPGRSARAPAPSGHLCGAASGGRGWPSPWRLVHRDAAVRRAIRLRPMSQAVRAPRLGGSRAHPTHAQPLRARRIPGAGTARQWGHRRFGRSRCGQASGAACRASTRRCRARHRRPARLRVAPRQLGLRSGMPRSERAGPVRRIVAVRSVPRWRSRCRGRARPPARRGAHGSRRSGSGRRSDSAGRPSFPRAAEHRSPRLRPNPHDVQGHGSSCAQEIGVPF